MLLGRKFNYWCDLDAVMQLYGIDGPGDLENRLVVVKSVISTGFTAYKPTKPCSFCEDGKLTLQVFRDSGYVIHHIDAQFCPQCGRKLS
jgi:hypothetical protein